MLILGQWSAKVPFIFFWNLLDRVETCWTHGVIFFAYIWDVIGISLLNWNQTTLQLPLDFTELKFEGVELPFNLGETDQKQVIINSWLVVWNIFYFSIYWECHHPSWRTPSFIRGVGSPHQPELVFHRQVSSLLSAHWSPHQPSSARSAISWLGSARSRTTIWAPNHPVNDQSWLVVTGTWLLWLSI